MRNIWSWNLALLKHTFKMQSMFSSILNILMSTISRLTYATNGKIHNLNANIGLMAGRKKVKVSNRQFRCQRVFTAVSVKQRPSYNHKDNRTNFPYELSMQLIIQILVAGIISCTAQIYLSLFLYSMFAKLFYWSPSYRRECSKIWDKCYRSPINRLSRI